VFDVLGRDIKTLVNENKSSGSYEVSFKAKNLTSGVYFYRIEIYSGNSRDAAFSETKKMLVLK